MKKKGELKKRYSFLGKTFEEWYRKKYKQAGGNLKSRKCPSVGLLKRLKTSEEEYYKTYIDPYLKLSKKDLDTTFKILASELVIEHTKEDIGAHCNLFLDLSLERKINALEWLLFQVKDLNIFHVSRKVKFPIQQCHYCGQPDHYTRYVEDKVKVIWFNKKSIFCHKDGCGKGSNPEVHENCCYGKWTRKRKTLENTLKEVCSDLYDIEEYEDAPLTQEQENILTQKAKKIFLEFCEKQYIENLKINYKLRAGDYEQVINLTDFSL